MGCCFYSGFLIKAQSHESAVPEYTTGQPAPFPSSVFLFPKESLNILFHRGNAGDTELIHQHVHHCRRKEGRQRRSQMDILHAEIQESQKDDDRLLFIPGNVVHDGQLIHIVKAECFLQLKGNEGEAVGVVALACLINPADNL